MIGMVCKDFLVLRRQLWYYLFFIVLYTALVVAKVFPSGILPVMVALIGLFLPMSSIGYDDQARWEKFAVATPAGRRGVVAGKYLFAILSIAAASALVLALMALLHALDLLEGDAAELPFTLPVCVGLSLLFNAFLLPLLLKFGAEKSRVISILIFLLIFGGAMLIRHLSGGTDLTLRLPALQGRALPATLLLLSAAALAVSYLVSLRIYARKAF